MGKFLLSFYLIEFDHRGIAVVTDRSVLPSALGISLGKVVTYLLAVSALTAFPTTFGEDDRIVVVKSNRHLIRIPLASIDML